MEPVILEKESRTTVNGEKYKFVVRMDFSDVPRATLLSWAFADRIIALQRVIRECTKESLEEFVREGYECHALAAGTKPRTTAEVIAETKERVAAMTPEQKEALLEMLMA